MLEELQVEMNETHEMDTANPVKVDLQPNDKAISPARASGNGDEDYDNGKKNHNKKKELVAKPTLKSTVLGVWVRT